ncbi:hypothetical protein PS673_03192 [Pseudomonas fluorescens]|jgi:hypothetical protein|uniref:Uncharacterized protein n=1 Tax=Pseudomonas fluorescens TaxID=294 RepID=A0A5E6U774_PSEFL|nr:hypothetical protein PS673_03192 [Pseudomonas fluorescens]
METDFQVCSQQCFQRFVDKGLASYSASGEQGHYGFSHGLGRLRVLARHEPSIGDGKWREGSQALR